MSISKRSHANNTESLALDFGSLASNLQRDCPEIVFALILGSAVDGTIAPYSDLDIAAYLDRKPSIEIFQRVVDTAEGTVPGVDIDLGFLNGNEAVYRFEALKGRLLFTRDQEIWLSFFSLTCREYEHWMFHYEKQRRYRIEYGSSYPP